MPTENDYWDDYRNAQGGAAESSAPVQIESEPGRAAAQPVHPVQQKQGVSQPASVQTPQVSQQVAQPQPTAQAQPAAQAQPQFATQAAPSAQPQPRPSNAQATRDAYWANAQQQAAGFQAPPAQGPYAQAVPMAATPPAKEGKSHGWIVGIVVVVCLFAFTAFCVNACTSVMSELGSLGVTGEYATDKLAGDGIAVIDMAGTIQYDGSACSPEGLKTLLDVAEDNPHVKAVVLRVDSGGGTATAGEEMAGYVKAFSKPIVVSSASINASAAYEISSQADYIYVAQSTEIGAIGTAMQLTDLSGLLDKLGVNMETITSADEKDSSYGYRPLTDEEREYYQHMVDEINEVFINNVAEGRKMSVDDVRALANGMPFTGNAAVKNGLADAVGTREDAIDKAAELAGVTGHYDSVDLYFPAYDLGSLSTLLGSDDSYADGLLRTLDRSQSTPHVR